MEDHSGSVIMEEIIRRNQMLTHLDNVGFAELILTGGWYLWWERRLKVHQARPWRGASGAAAPGPRFQGAPPQVYAY